MTGCTGIFNEAGQMREAFDFIFNRSLPVGIIECLRHDAVLPLGAGTDIFAIEGHGRCCTAGLMTGFSALRGIGKCALLTPTGVERCICRHGITVNDRTCCGINA